MTKSFRFTTARSSREISAILDHVFLDKPAFMSSDRWRRGYSWKKLPAENGSDAQYELLSTGIAMAVFAANTVQAYGTICAFTISGHQSANVVSMDFAAPHLNFGVNTGGMVIHRYAQLLKRRLA